MDIPITPPFNFRSILFSHCKYDPLIPNHAVISSTSIDFTCSLKSVKISDILPVHFDKNFVIQNDNKDKPPNNKGQTIEHLYPPTFSG